MMCMSSAVLRIAPKYQRILFFTLFFVFTVGFVFQTIASAQGAQNPNPNQNPCAIDPFSPGCNPAHVSRQLLPKETKNFIIGKGASDGTPCTGITGVTGTGEPNLEDFTDKIFTYVISDFISRATGAGCTRNGLIFLGPPPKGEQLAYYQNGALPTLADATSFIAVVPVSTAEYIAYMKESIQNPFGAQPAYAQGFGFSSLRPVLDLWRIFRNIAYFFFVLIFLVTGFLIMFRSKIGGQAAVTVQQALPKVIVALLLVTFSYAIAGVMIDAMYLMIYLMIGIFSRTDSIDGALEAANLTKVAFSENIFGNTFMLMGGGVAGTIAGQIGVMVRDLLEGTGWTNWTAGIAGLGADIITHLVIVVALLVNMFRIFFALLRAYVGVVLSIVLAPIQLLLGAIPGQNTFGAWLRGLWENLLVFPVVIFLIFMAMYFSYKPDRWGNQGQGGFAAPQLGLHQGVAGNIVLAFLQFGILALIPSAVDLAKGLAKGQLNVDVGKAMGDFWKRGKLGQTIALGAIGAGVGAIGGGIGGLAYGAYRASREKDPAKKALRFRQGFTTGFGAGVIGGTAAPIAIPYGWRLGKRAISDAASGYAQAAFTGTLEARSARLKALRLQKEHEAGSYEGKVPK